MAKSDNREIKRRVQTVYKLIVSGVSKPEILEYIIATWDVAQATAYSYFNKAEALFEQDAQTEREKELGKAISRLANLFQKTYAVQDYKTALQVQKELNTLLGLYPDAQIKHTGSDGGDIVIKVKYDDHD